MVAFGIAARALGTVREGYQIDQLQSQLAQLQRDRESLELQLAQAQSLERIRAVATSKLRMKEPDTFRFASVTVAADANAYGFRTDLAGGSQAAKAPMDEGPAQETAGLVVAQASAQPAAKVIADTFHRILRWLTTVRQANAGSWD
ncbi:MAG TPA: hypothetical protein VGL40_10005 [Bacillota bacterium]